MLLKVCAHYLMTPQWWWVNKFFPAFLNKEQIAPKKLVMSSLKHQFYFKKYKKGDRSRPWQDSRMVSLENVFSCGFWNGNWSWMTSGRQDTAWPSCPRATWGGPPAGWPWRTWARTWGTWRWPAAWCPWASWTPRCTDAPVDPHQQFPGHLSTSAFRPEGQFYTSTPISGDILIFYIPTLSLNLKSKSQKKSHSLQKENLTP